MERGKSKTFLITHHPQPNPWDCKTSGNQCVGAFRRLFALSVASIPARVSTGSHLPRVYNVLEAGVYRGLARYAWLRMVRNQENFATALIRRDAVCQCWPVRGT